MVGTGRKAAQRIPRQSTPVAKLSTLFGFPPRKHSFHSLSLARMSWMRRGGTTLVSDWHKGRGLPGSKKKEDSLGNCCGFIAFPIPGNFTRNREQLIIKGTEYTPSLPHPVFLHLCLCLLMVYSGQVLLFWVFLRGEKKN